jgi:hypothetical protein
MSLFDNLGQNQQPTQQMNPMQMVQQLQSNPVGFLKNAGYNIPEGLNNPNQIIQHLLQSGQVTQGRYQQAVQRFQQMTNRK